VAELFDSILDTVGDTPTIRINNLKAGGSTIHVKAEFFNPAGGTQRFQRTAVGLRPACAKSPAEDVRTMTNGRDKI
jgi:hypothetical protein